MSTPTKFNQGDRVALVSDTSCRGTIYSINHPYTLGDTETYNVNWDKYGTYMYFSEMLVLESKVVEKK